MYSYLFDRKQKTKISLFYIAWKDILYFMGGCSRFEFVAGLGKRATQKMHALARAGHL